MNLDFSTKRQGEGGSKLGGNDPFQEPWSGAEHGSESPTSVKWFSYPAGLGATVGVESLSVPSPLLRDPCSLASCSILSLSLLMKIIYLWLNKIIQLSIFN